MSKNYVGRTNRNGTKVTRATHGRLDVDFVRAAARRAVARAERWLRANPDHDIAAAPRHIRERVGA